MTPQRPSFASAIRILHRLRQEGGIRDFALFGAVAAAAYIDPVFTQDMDVLVLVDSAREYLDLLPAVAAAATAVDHDYYVLGGIPVQIFPTTIKPLYADTYQNAQDADLDGIRVRVATPEHLILLAPGSLPQQGSSSRVSINGIG